MEQGTRIFGVGRIAFDTRKPDGTLRKLLRVGYLAGLGWHARTQPREGMTIAHEDFVRRS